MSITESSVFPRQHDLIIQLSFSHVQIQKNILQNTLFFLKRLQIQMRDKCY